jgi:hypothetical protein
VPSLGRRLSARPRDAEAWADLTLAAILKRGNLMRMARLLKVPARTMQHLHQTNHAVWAVVEYHRRNRASCRNH